MTNNTRYIVAFAVVGAILGTLAFFGLTPFGRDVVQQIAGTSPAGTTGQTAKFFSIAANLASPGANGTSSSILNTSANDFYILAIKAGCSGIGSSNTAYSGGGLAALKLTVATTSTSAPATNGVNVVGGGTITIATSTVNYVVASSTAQMPGLSSTTAMWASGSYMTFSTNATNTAACVFGVEAMSS